MKKEHILVIRFSAMGDVAMTVPVVWSLAQQYPHVRITVLSRSFAKSFFENLAPNVGFMEADLKKEYHGIKGLNALYRRLVAKQFTAVADLHSVLRSEYLRMRFNMGPFRVAHINKHRKGRRRITSANHKKLAQQPTSFENYSEVFRKLGYPVEITFKSIFADCPDGKGDLNELTMHNAQCSMHNAQCSMHNAQCSMHNAQSAAAKDGAGNNCALCIEHCELKIGIAPFAAHEGKVYPPHLMQQVIEQLIQQHPQAHIFLFGRGEQEDKYFAEWCRQYPQCVNVSKLANSLRQELILISHLNVMISMDSSNMHLASLTGTPVVSVWGATHPYAGFMGWGQKEENAVQLDMDCRPCSIYGQKPCKRGDYACMNNIKPETIVEKTNNILLTQNKH